MWIRQYRIKFFCCCCIEYPGRWQIFWLRLETSGFSNFFPFGSFVCVFDSWVTDTWALSSSANTVGNDDSVKFSCFSSLVLGLPIRELLCRSAGISEIISLLRINSTISHLMINSLVKALPLNGLLGLFLWDHIKTENLSLLFLVKRTTMQTWMSQIIAKLCVPSPTSKPHQGNWEYFLFVLSTGTLTSFARSSHYQEAKNLTSLLIGMFRK